MRDSAECEASRTDRGIGRQFRGMELLRNRVRSRPLLELEEMQVAAVITGDDLLIAGKGTA